MHQGKYVFAQFLEFISPKQFSLSVNKYKGNYKVKTFSCWDQFLCLCYGQLVNCSSLRNIVLCLNAHENKLYHLGIRGTVKRSTFATANEIRDWRIYEDLALKLVKRVIPLYANDDFGVDLKNTVYALDSSTINLCLSVFPWAKFRQTKGAVRLHTLMDLRGSIPVYIDITDGKVHDVNILDKINYEYNAFYVIDRGYIDFSRLNKINSALAFFVTRLKTNTSYKRLYSQRVDKQTGVLCDQTIKLTGYKNSYEDKLRRIKYKDIETDIVYEFLTNNFDVSALTIAILYKKRWNIELFFKWIKQHLKIKIFWGESENAVKTQIWVAIITYLMVAIIKKTLAVKLSIYEIHQILGTSVFDKTPIKSILSNISESETKSIENKQLKLW